MVDEKVVGLDWRSLGCCGVLSGIDGKGWMEVCVERVWEEFGDGI